MEILENVMTLNFLILKHRPKVIATQPSLLKPLSLYIFRILLCAIRVFHSTGWTHNDLHGENVLIQIRSNRPPKLYILDFGKVKKSGDIQQDMEDIVGLFQRMLMGYGNQTSINKYAKTIFTTKDRKELSDLINKCSFLVHEILDPIYTIGSEMKSIFQNIFVLYCVAYMELRKRLGMAIKQCSRTSLQLFRQSLKGHYVC